MTIQCDLMVSGIPIQNSAKKITNAIEKVANMNHVRKYRNVLNNNFQNYISNNMYRAGMENVQDLEESFFAEIINDKLIFGSTEPLIANKYEYGWENDDDYDEDNYLVSTSPRYYIRPAVNRISQDLEDILVQDIYKEYNKNDSTNYSSYIITNNISYLNKYSNIL